MTEVKRGPGRPPKVRPEAVLAPEFEGQNYDVPTPVFVEPEASFKAASVPAVPAERMIEVEIVRKYAPGGQTQEIMKVVYPGTVMKLPVAEATAALKKGIARATDLTFG